MAHYLLIYDRKAGRLLREETFADGASAIAARFAAEHEFDAQAEIEVVVVAAENHEELRATHGRYFLGLRELTARLG